MKTNGPAPPGLTREPREYQAGVPSFSSDPYRFHEMKELDAYTLNQMVATLGWNKVVSQLAPTPAKDYLHPQRRLPLSLLPVKPGDTVLEAGAGWASLAYPMAKTHPQAKVYAYDTNLEALFFLSLLKQAQSLENLAILRGDLINLPFEDGFFNHILLMGTPTSPPVPPRSRDHRSAPPRVLQEAFRVLANRGTLMAGVDSRFGRHYRNGGSGPPGPRFTDLLPRSLTRLYARTTGNSHREEAASTRQGYLAHLRDCGFTDIEVFAAVPSYRRPLFITNLDALKSALLATPQGYRRRRWLTAIPTPLLKRMVPSFLILAGKRTRD